MKNLSLLPLNSRHNGKWVAFNKAFTRVEGYATQLARLKERMGKRDVVYFLVPDDAN